MTRSVSVVINTYNRAESLRVTLAALEQLDTTDFEVVVVNGPSSDDTAEVLAGYAGRIKVGRCSRRNLAESRNIGIRLAAGEIVAFIDDDAYPDPAWLDRLVAAYDDPEVAAAGGPTFNFTGFGLQAWYNFVDRFGNGSFDLQPGLASSGFASTPFGERIPYNIGTNASFRRDALIDVGGFDEHYFYYLEESDLCCRLVARGLVVCQLDDGFVYHKFLPSWVRDSPDAVKDYYEVIKSKCYFALTHGVVSHSFYAVCRDIDRFVEARRAEVADALASGLLSEADAAKFELDVQAASTQALQAFVAGPQTRSREWFGSRPEDFVPFGVHHPDGARLTVCYLSSEYPPVRVNGIGRVVHSLATGMASAGHVVHVITRGEVHPRVDLEEGVWVHRMPVVPREPPSNPNVPRRLWEYSAVVAEELIRIDERRPVDIVQAPNWDSEGVAVILDGRYRVVVGLYTPLLTLARVDPGVAAALGGKDPTLAGMVALERFTYEQAAGLLACGPSVVDEIDAEYGLSLRDGRLGLVPHGLPDRAAQGGAVDPTAGDGPTILFVGRLEARKGIDLLLACATDLLRRYSDVTVVIAGDDSLLTPGGRTYRAEFEDTAPPSIAARVQFLGPVDDAALSALYARCDVLVVPSRFESFGLMLLEAMMYAKPVVAAAVGGMPEIVVDGETGLLVPPGDAGALGAALSRLIESPELRTSLGRAGRRRYEERYSQAAMVDGAVEFYRSLIAATPSSAVLAAAESF
jgi:glycosyltransferase involved in cell wall biosynthesis